MPLFNRAAAEVTLRLAYEGPAFSGKTTNLRWLHEHVACPAKGKLVSLKTGADRTLFFEFLPFDPGELAGLRPRIQLYTVPGRVHDEASRSAVLRGCDAIVFVADSDSAMLDANAEGLRALRERLLTSATDSALPCVLQYNKRDLSTALPLPLLEERLNPSGLPSCRATATRGDGVEETLRAALKLVFERLARQPGAGAAPEEKDGLAVRETATIETVPPTHVETALARLAAPEEPASRSASIDPTPDQKGLGPDDWLYLLDGEQRGPLGFEGLVDLLLTSIPEDTKVWRPGMETWRRAGEVEDLAVEIPPPVPVGIDAGAASADDDFPDFESVPRLLRTALIADEDATFRRYLAAPLAAQGFAIDEAGDGAEAWQLAVQNRPWLILADVSMPELDGFEFCRRVRQHPLLRRRPVVFISGSDRYRDRYRALQIGADDFLSKSMPIRELLIRMQLVMTRYAEVRAWESADGRSELTASLKGRLEVFGAPDLLQICAERRLTGVLKAIGADPTRGTAEVRFRGGEAVSAVADGLAGLDAVYAFLAWQKGDFRVEPIDPGPGMPLAKSVEHLLLEGSRRIEEARREGSERV